MKTADRAAIGAPGPPVTCTTTLAPGADVEKTLLAAAPGDVVCLAPGGWGTVTLTDVAPAGNVTLAGQPGAAVHVRGLTIAGESDRPSDTRNLTVQGLWIDRGVQDLTDSSGGLVFAHNTIEHIAQGYGFYFNADGNGGHHAQSGIRVEANRIAAVGACLELAGGTGREFTFAHNICGPGIGYGDTSSDQPGHYIEVGGISGLTVTDNVFLGPSAASTARAGLHLNVLHVFGGGRHITFSHNLLWHSQARGQAILLQEGPFADLRIDGNLDVEDPGCRTAASGCRNYMIESAHAHGLSFSHNTVVDAYWGVLLTVSNEDGDYPSGDDYTVSHNLVLGAHGAAAISYGGCVSACVFEYNVTDDGSAAQRGSRHYVDHWSLAWADRYYRPAGLPFPAGYAGGDEH